MNTIDKNELEMDEKARKTVAHLMDKGEISTIPLQKLQFYATYMQGMRDAYMKLFPMLIASAKKSEKPYLEAEYRLLTSCVDACYDYQMGFYELHYRNHRRDKKGNLVSCEAYFVKKSTFMTEVRYGKK